MPLQPEPEAAIEACHEYIRAARFFEGAVDTPAPDATVRRALDECTAAVRMLKQAAAALPDPPPLA